MEKLGFVLGGKKGEKSDEHKGEIGSFLPFLNSKFLRISVDGFDQTHRPCARRGAIS
ncbi:hypothetical protein R3W88_027804 [Solanum pinnatisectum]|uniref:Uncharacterized protein n=1 Tax=Solanum pinnatisectum TaxID=50273 RepID=A0AAV9LJK0_9SOLN|nr:hypothetical protein R3W88_027804 [Solanum pinnatisectum]